MMIIYWISKHSRKSKEMKKGLHLFPQMRDSATKFNIEKKLSSDEYFLQWERLGGCDDEGEADQREESGRSAQGWKDEMDAQNERGDNEAETERERNKGGMEKDKKDKMYWREEQGWREGREREREKNKHSQSNVRGCCSACI